MTTLKKKTYDVFGIVVLTLCLISSLAMVYKAILDFSAGGQYVSIGILVLIIAAMLFSCFSFGIVNKWYIKTNPAELQKPTADYMCPKHENGRCCISMSDCTGANAKCSIRTAHYKQDHPLRR